MFKKDLLLILMKSGFKDAYMICLKTQDTSGKTGISGLINGLPSFYHIYVTLADMGKMENATPQKMRDGYVTSVLGMPLRTPSYIVTTMIIHKKQLWRRIR